MGPQPGCRAMRSPSLAVALCWQPAGPRHCLARESLEKSQGPGASGAARRVADRGSWLLDVVPAPHSRPSVLLPIILCKERCDSLERAKNNSPSCRHRRSHQTVLVINSPSVATAPVPTGLRSPPTPSTRSQAPSRECYQAPRPETAWWQGSEPPTLPNATSRGDGHGERRTQGNFFLPPEALQSAQPQTPSQAPHRLLCGCRGVVHHLSLSLPLRPFLCLGPLGQWDGYCWLKQDLDQPYRAKASLKCLP